MNITDHRHAHYFKSAVLHRKSVCACRTSPT